MLALALAPLLAAAPEARAELLIGNLNIGTATAATANLTGSRDTGQGFTTGTNTGGYTLESIQLFFERGISAGDIGDLTVTLRSESSGNPGTTLHTLVNPASIAGETNKNNITAADAATFTAPSGTVLAANTTYFVVLEFDQERDLWGTDSGDEESGGAAGWSIADDGRDKEPTWSSYVNPYYIRVNGAERAANSPATGAPTISGTAQVGETLTAATTAISDTDGLTSVSYSYQWIRVDGGNTDISGATSGTYVPVDDDAGKKVNVKVSFTDDDGNAEGPLTSAAYPATGTIVGRPTVASVEVTSTPTAETDTYGVGEKIQFTVTFSEAVAVSTGRPHFEFSLDGTNTDAAYEGGSGTTALTFAYTVQATDEDDNGIWIGDETRTIMFDSGEYIRSVATSLDADLDHSEHGTQSGHKVDGNLIPPGSNTPATGAPTIRGTAAVGRTLAAFTTGISDTDGLTGVSYAYQWIRVDSDGNSNATDISGATSAAYMPVAADVGKRVKVKVSFTDDEGNEEELTGAAYPATGTIMAMPARPPGGGIWSAVLNVGDLSVVPGFSSIGCKNSRLVRCSDPAFLTDNTFSYDGADYTVIQLENSPSTSQFAIEVTASAATTTDSIMKLENDLTLDIGDHFSLPFSDAVEQEFSNPNYVWTDPRLAAATTPFRVGASLGLRIRSSAVMNSAATGAPAITGTAEAGQTLTASTAGISDTNGLTGVSYAYQWIRVDSDGNSNATAIPGATRSTYVPVLADVGKRVKVRVAFRDDVGNDEELTSAAYPAAETIVAPSNVPATLDGLSLSGIELDESFAPDRTDYTATVAHAVTRTTVTAELTSPGATLTILPADAASEDGHQVDLDVGATDITVRVTTPDGDEETYRVTVTRELPRPAAPVGFGGSGDAGTVTLDWQAPAAGGEAVLRYEYRYRSVGGAWPASWTPVPGGASARRLEVAGLESTGRYEFEFRAVGANGPGPVSSATVGGSTSYGTLTAEFEEHPDPLVHFGAAFRVTLKFPQLVRGERPEMIGRGVRVSGGTARHAEPLFERPQHVYLEVTPSGNGDVEVVLVPLPCEVAGSICTSGGNGLAGRQTLSVRGVAGVPGRPANVRGLRTDDGYVVLFWDLDEKATAYQLRWRRSGADEWRNESGRPPGPGVHIIRGGPTALAPAELPAEAFGPLERGRDYDVELRWENPHGDGSWLDVTDAVDNLVPPRPRSLTLTQRGPSAVALDWRPGSVSGSTSIAKHQVRLAREPQYLPGGVDLQYPDIRAFRDDGWVDIPDSGHNEANFGGAVLSGTFGGRPLLHVWELKAQVRAVSAAGAVSQASEVALVPETAPEFAGFELLSRPAHGTTWSVGETIAVALVVGEPVTVTGGTPALTLRIGGETREAAFTRVFHPDWAYEGGWIVNSGTRLRFEYAIQAGDATDAATGGIEVPGGRVRLNGAVVRDGTLLGAGVVRRRAVLSWASGTVLDNSAVDAVAPVLERVTRSGNRMTLIYDKELDETSRLYEEAEPFRVSYGTSRVLGRSVSAIAVAGREVRLTLAPVLRGQVIHRGPLSDESVRVSYSGLPNHARLRLRDTSGNEAPAFEDRWASHVQSGQQTELTPLTVAFESLPGRHDGEDEPFTFRLRFSEPVSVGWKNIRDRGFEVTGGRVTGARRVDGRSDRWELTVTPSSQGEVTVTLPLGRACTETGAFCTADKRTLSNGLLGLVAGPATSVTRVTGARLVTGPGENGTWDAGETVTAEVTFSAAVTVQGAPTLGVTLDGVRREAAHASGEDTQTLRFSYPVTAADAGATEARLVANGFDTSNGIVGDALGRRAVLDFAVAPYVTGVAVLPEASGDGVWTTGETIEAELTFSEAVTVTGGTPTVEVTAGNAAKTAAYASGAGTASLVFAYPVTAADGTVTQAALTADSLALNGAALKASASGLAAELGHDGVEPAAETVLAVLPALSVSDAQAVEGAGAVLAFTVTLAPAATGTVTVDWATADGTAVAGSDYTAGTGTLTFAPGETSKTVSVAVVDDSTVETGSGETVTLGLSNASGAVLADASATGTIADDDTAPVTPGTALTAQFTDVPSAHAGPFAFRVSFSEALATGSGRLVPGSFAATGATVTGVRKMGVQSSLWEVSVRPRPGEDAQVTLAGGRSCETAGAVCAAGGGTLSNSVSATVPSAPMLSISDARAVEGVDASMTFTVTLAPAATGPVTVDYATGGGSATAGQDYTGVAGRLRFAAGETSKTIEVAVFADDHDEDEEIFHIVLYRADGAYIADGAGRGTISNSGAMPRAWLSRFGRTVAEQAVDAVESRFAASRQAGVAVNVAGRAIGAGGAAAGDEAAQREAEEAGALERMAALSDWLRGDEDDGEDGKRSAGARAVTPRDLLTGTSFALTAETSGGGFGSVWGRGAVSRFDGREGSLSLEGDVTSAMLGADLMRDAGTVGVMLMHSRGAGSYRGTDEGKVSSTVTGLYPYGRYRVGPRLDVWGVAGYGGGSLTLTPKGDRALRADIDLMMAAAGLRGVALEAPAEGGLELAVTSDALAVRTSSEKVAGLAAAEGDATRLRVGLQGSWRGGALTPRLEVGIRQDGGDAETGFGADIGAGLAWWDAARGIAVDVSARGLLTHEASGFRDRGIAGTLSWDPTPGSDRGASLTLGQSFGGSSQGGMDALLGRETLAGLAANDNGAGDGGDELRRRRLDLRLGYGLSALGDRFTSTPELGLGLSNDSREYSLGWRLNLTRGGPTSLELGLEATRREYTGGARDAGHAVGLRLTARW